MGDFADSFAEGFASGFGSAYKSSAQRFMDKQEAEAKEKKQAALKAAEKLEKKEDDKVKEALGRFTKRFDKWQENETKDLEYKSTAMNTVASYGGRIPEGTWETIYTELWSGRTIEQIREDIDKKGFVEVKAEVKPSVGTVEDQTNAVLNTKTTLPGTEGGATLEDGLWKKVITQESGGKQVGLDGKILESSKGALGISQSLVSTAGDPGYGAKSIFDIADEAGISYAAKDENSAKALLANKNLNEAFGKNYLEAMMTRYGGDQEKALIAYNAGPSVADKYDGDRSTLPKETQGYLQSIIGSGDTASTANVNQDNWAVYAQDRPLVMKALGIEGELYDRVIKGFTPEFPAIKYAWGVDPEKEKKKPDWQITDKIRKDNYISYAAAAREAGDEVRAIFIESVGEKLKDPTKPAKYLDGTNFTNPNIAEGLLLAAENDLANAKTDKEKADAQKGIENAKTYLSRTTDNEEWYLKGDLTMTNVNGRIAKATAKGDMKALAYFHKFVKDNSTMLPKDLSLGYVSSQYATLAIKAATGTEDDKKAFNSWKETELPILVTALRLNDKDSGKANTIIAAYDALAKAKEDPNNPEGIAAAEKRVREVLNAEATKEIVKRGGTPILLIKKEKDADGEYTGNFEQTTGYIKPKEDGSGGFYYANTNGDVLEGYEELRPDVDSQARQVVASDSLRKKIDKYQGARQNAVNSVRLFGDIAKIVEEDERVLTSVAGFTVAVDSALRNVSVGIGLLDDMFKQKGGGDDVQLTLSEVTTKLRSEGILKPNQTLQDLADTPTTSLELSDNAKGLAQRKAIFEAKMILFTFRAGGLEGQSGQAMSNKDFDRLRQMLTAGGGKEAFLTATQSYVNDRVTAARDLYTDLREGNNDLKNFINRHNYDPLKGELGTRSIDEVIADNASDPRLKAGAGYLTKTWELKPAPKNPPEPKVETFDVNTLVKEYMNGNEIVVTPEFFERYKRLLEGKGIKVGDKIKAGAN
jgi:hypothetical protein